MVLIFSAAYTFLFSGAFRGWAPLQLTLEEGGSFSSLCTHDVNDVNPYSDAVEVVKESCLEQKIMLIYV